jgi:integrase/recombinase XerD
MTQGIDIHDFSAKLERLRVFVAQGAVKGKCREKVPISQCNANLILGFERARSLAGIGTPTRCGDICRLVCATRLLAVDFDKATKDDVKRMVVGINEKYSAWNAMKIRMTFKTFFRWMRQGDDYLESDEFPDEVKWIRRALRKKDLPVLKATDCWTDEEIEKLLSVAEHPRDKVIVSLIAETGARVGEIGGLKVGDVYQDEFSFLIHVSGKTGERDPRVIYSGPHLASWLNIHPHRDDPNAPLFPNIYNGHPLSYKSIRKLFVQLAKRAGIKNKRCNPHIFRHSKATQLAAQGWPEPLIKEYLGWKKDSDMMSTYSHITAKQANAYLLKKHGIVTEKQEPKTLTVQICATCHQENAPEVLFCSRCGRPLGHEALLKYNHTRNQASAILDKLVQDPEFVRVLETFMARKSNNQSSTATTTLPS